MNFYKIFSANTVAVAILSVVLLSCDSSKTAEIGASIDTSEIAIQRGKLTFDQQCSSCHNFQQNSIGPNLSGLTYTVETEWIRKFIKNPASLINGKDERAVKLYEKYHTFMPAFEQLGETTIENLISYIHTYTDLPKIEEDNSLTDPIPAKVGLSNTFLDLKYVMQAPASSDKPPLARINKMECNPQGRVFSARFERDSL